MIARPVQRSDISEREAQMWENFLSHYLASGTRGAVDVFLRGLVGVPRG